MATPRQHSAEKAVREIQKYFFEICNFHTLTSAIHQIKDQLLVNLPIVSDFQRLYSESTTYDYVRSEPSHKNTHSHFSSQREGSQKAEM